MLPRPLVGLAFVLSSFIQSVSAAEISYSRDVQPIFTAKCVACHACYDSPCQLNLSSAEGAQRGANQLPVYAALGPRRRKPPACTSMRTVPTPGGARTSGRCSNHRTARPH